MNTHTDMNSRCDIYIVSYEHTKSGSMQKLKQLWTKLTGRVARSNEYISESHKTYFPLAHIFGQICRHVFLFVSVCMGIKLTMVCTHFWFAVSAIFARCKNIPQHYSLFLPQALQCILNQNTCNSKQVQCGVKTKLLLIWRTEHRPWS